MHAGLWQKANELVAKENAMYPVPGTQNNQAFFVESASGGPSKPNHVVIKPNSGVVCDCDKFKETRLCSHSIAVSERTGTFESHILWFKKTEFQPNLSSLAVREGPSVQGQKPGSKRPRNRSRNPPSRNDVLGASNNSGAPNEKIWQNDNPFQLMFLTPNKKNESPAKHI